jgi:hypothetical protein
MGAPLGDKFYAEPFDEDQLDLSSTIRDAYAEVANKLDDLLPDSREKSLAITNLEQSGMWANTCIARNPMD